MIDKIRIDGQEFGVGGSNKAKLVAEGIYDSENSSNDWEIRYKINIKLKPNTFYFVRRYDSYMESWQTVLFFTNNGGYAFGFNIFATETDSDTLIPCAFEYQNDEDEFYIGNSLDLSLYKSIEDILEVYELPITLGGNE